MAVLAVRMPAAVTAMAPEGSDRMVRTSGSLRNNVREKRAEAAWQALEGTVGRGV